MPFIAQGEENNERIELLLRYRRLIASLETPGTEFPAEEFVFVMEVLGHASPFNDQLTFDMALALQTAGLKHQRYL